MRFLFGLMVVLTILSCKQKSKQAEEVSNEMEKTEPAQSEWTILFDGSSFENWHYYNGGDVIDPWKIEDGAMVFYPPENRPEGANYNLVTNEDYQDFTLSLEWKISEGGNSGLFWGVFEDEKLGQPYQTGPEIQVLDDERHPDAKNGKTHQSGSLYDMVAPSENAVKPAGEWNACSVTINHTTNEGNVILNGVEVVKFPVHGPMWEEMIANSKFADWEGFGVYQKGKIGLQDHGDKVAYRNIKIKIL